MAKEQKKIELICKTCGNPFIAYKSKHRKFCSKKCVDVSGEKHGLYVHGLRKDKSAWQKLQWLRYPEKMRARQKLHTEIRSGRMKRLPCIKCGAIKSQAHHEDYSKPLEVIWLCQKCHNVEHAKSSKSN